MRALFNWNTNTLQFGGYWKKNPKDTFEAQVMRVPPFGVHDDSYPMYVVLRDGVCIATVVPYRNPRIRSVVEHLCDRTPTEVFKFLTEKNIAFRKNEFDNEH